ncbi:RibD family protein [Haloechinothrix salitolerans]|uniref:RibD family protein n=1 Tax=Haloechinothrix salitolerans TaxID=926830 RepID=A0ABW2BV34_9PSEU
MRPYVLLSVATSIDGYIDDTSSSTLVLSGPADKDRVDGVRAECDAILVGAGTLRADNPRLTVSDRRRSERLDRGYPEHPLKVVVTASGDLDPDLRFWRHGGAILVYTVNSVAGPLRARLDSRAEVVGLGPDVDFSALLDDLAEHGVKRLMVEGGGQTHTAFLSRGLVDEIQLAIAPVVIGQSGAPRFLNPASYPGGPARRMRLVESRTVGDVVLLRYLTR